MKKRDRRKRQTITAQAASKLASTETSKELVRPLRLYAIWTLSALCAFVVTVLGIWSLSAPSQTAIKTANPRPQSSVRGLDFWFDFGSIDRRTSVRSGKAMIEV